MLFEQDAVPPCAPEVLTGARGRSVRDRLAALRRRVERLLLWRVWERLLEIEFLDRSVALAGKAFVSFFPTVIVIAAFMPEGVRSAILTTLTRRLGFEGDALALAQEAFSSSDDVQQATGLLGLAFTIFFATSFTTALRRVYLRSWRRPPRSGAGAYWRGLAWLLATVTSMAIVGGLRGVLDGAAATVLFAIVSISVTVGLWWFTPWLLLAGDVRPRVLLPGGVVTGVAMAVYAGSATIWMPEVLEGNEDQFGLFGVALALVTWFSGAAICILLGACVAPVLAEDPGGVGRFVRGGDSILSAGAAPSLPPPTRDLSLRDAFQAAEEP